jgi:hypothetical protein
VSNPFVVTREAVGLLRLRAGQVSGADARGRFRTFLRPRIA